MNTRGVAAWSGGWSWTEVGGGASKRSPVPESAPNKGLEQTPYSLRYAAAAGRCSGLAFGFFLHTEGNLLRVNDILYDARARRGDEVARCDEGTRSHMVRPLPDVLSLALSRDPL